MRNILLLPLALTLLGLAPVTASSTDYETVAALQDGRLYREAFEQLKGLDADSSTDPRLLRLLADAYTKGLGTVADPARGVALYKRAAAAGDTVAALRLGTMYEDGEGLPKSALKAFEWYLKAADKEPEAAYKVAVGILANPDTSDTGTAGDPVQRLTFAAEGGYAPAQQLLGGLYMEGVRVKRDPALASKWLEAAGGDTPEANRQLGILYSSSTTAETREKGLGLLKRAYEGGDGIAAAYLGVYTERAAMSTEDRKAALGYYKEASSTGMKWVQEGIQRIEAHLASPPLLGMRMHGTRRDELVKAMASRGVEPGKSAKGVYDAFPSASLVPGSESMTVMYLPGAEQYIAEIAFRFGAASSNELYGTLLKVKGRMTEVYGIPKASPSQDLTQWRVGDTEITLKTEKARGKIALVYKFQPYAAELAKFIEETRKTARTTTGAAS